MPQDYPDSDSYKPPHPVFCGIHEVKSASKKGVTYEVDFDTGECSCAHGKAWRYVTSNKRWYPNNWCTHKMRAAASLLSHTDDPSAQAAYNKLLGERYIIYESVSAFHKELRRGDHKAAQYWALSVGAHRGLIGVIRYMTNILFEESRDLDMYALLMNLSEKGRKVTYDETMAAVRLFCKIPKKWELEPRLGIFLDEMRGYRALAKDYTYQVARAKDIIDPSENPKLVKSLIHGLHVGDRVAVQYGLKGILKSMHEKGERHHIQLKVQLFNILTDALNKEGPFNELRREWAFDEDYALRVHSLVMRRYSTLGDFGYHELNALCDAITGEAYPNGEHLLSKPLKRLYGAKNKPYVPPLGLVKTIPLYALDNHNYRGKALMKRWAMELQPGAEQDNLDFRWCGAYMGVAWRYLAYNQLQSCEVKWGDVKWNKPPWLYKHLSNMFY